VLQRTLYTFLKRALDILAASIGLLLLLPFFGLIAILIKRDSPGPVFFWCNRAGRYGKPFRMLKFRTMYEQPSSYLGPPITCNHDERITPIGRWLRDSKINELPQLWNVLKGEMSLVGPRPEDIKVVEHWPADAKAEILSIRPGITSPASIIYHDEEHRIRPDHVMGDYLQQILPDKMRLDRLYVRNQSLTADLDIIFWTLAIFVPIVAKAKIPENLLFFGPLSRLVYRYLNWFVIDLVVSLFAFTLVGLIAQTQLADYWGPRQLLILAITMALIFSGINFVLGFNRIVWRYATVNDGINLLAASTAVALLVLIFNHLLGVYQWFGFPALPPQLILIMCMLAQVGLLTSRYRLRLISSISSRWLKWRRYSTGFGEKVVIVGLGGSFQSVVQLLRSEAFRYVFQIIGVVDDNATSQIGMWVGECLVLGRTSDLPDLIKKHDIGIIFVADENIPDETKQMICSLRQVHSELRIAIASQIIRSLEQQMIQANQRLPDPLIWSPDSTLYLALHDPLTELPNRYLFCEELQHALAFSTRYHTTIAVLLIKLETILPPEIYLTKVETSGLMKQVASRLMALKRKSDTLAYLGKNEFGLILENLISDENIFAIAQRIKHTLAEPVVLNNHCLLLNAEISLCSNLKPVENMELPQQKLNWLLKHRTPLTVTEGLRL
jgi:diguanylate cyclase (GGDEF)-like protein